MTGTSGTNLACPRCGYDLGGSYHAIPPGTVRGKCSECGLEFDWIDITDAHRHELAWLYEHAPRRGRPLALHRAWATLRRTLAPWRFWRELTMHRRISRGRLLLWLPVLIVPLHLIWAMVSMLRRYLYFVAFAPGGWNTVVGTQWETFFINAWLYPVAEMHGVPRLGLFQMGFRDASYTFLFPLCVSLMMPLVLMLLSASRATSKVRAVHVLRAAVYGLGWLAWWYLLWTVLTAGAVVSEWIAGPPGPGFRAPAPGQLFANVWPAGRTARWLHPGPLSVSLCLIWFAAYWWFAISRGMQLARPRLVWGLLMIICLLAGVALAMVDRAFNYAIGTMLM